MIAIKSWMCLKFVMSYHGLLTALEGLEMGIYTLTAWMRLKLNFHQIRQMTKEIAALDNLKNQCLAFFSVAIDTILFIPLTKKSFNCGILFSNCLSVHPSVTFRFFLNILASQQWKYIKFCMGININKMYIFNKN